MRFGPACSRWLDRPPTCEAGSHFVRVHILVTGRVQGVGFRYFTAMRARSLGLTGMARNLSNGQVEVTAEGTRAALEALIELVRDGPPGALVREIHVNWEDAPAREREFLIR